MLRRLSSAIDRRVSPVTGWLFVLAGVAILALTLLLPAWLKLRDLKWHHGLMQAQADRMTQQSVRYEQLLFALESDDPLLMRRLAYQHFHLKPRNATLLTADHDLADGASPQTLGVESWLHLELPEVGRDYPEQSSINTRLVRLTAGPKRLLLFIAGGLCLAVGLFMPTTADEVEAEEEAESPEDEDVEATDEADDVEEADGAWEESDERDDDDEIVAELDEDGELLDEWDEDGDGELDEGFETVDLDVDEDAR